MDENKHKLLAIWAADCAEHVLMVFEKEHPEDARPSNAVKAARLWAQGVIKISEARKFSFAAHAAARDACYPVAKAAARSAGHAAATAHVPEHARHAASYAVKASKNPDIERDWQLRCFPAF